MLFAKPPECRSCLTNLVHNFFFTHKVVVHFILHTLPLHRDLKKLIGIETR